MKQLYTLAIVAGILTCSQANTVVTFDDPADMDTYFNKSTGADFSHSAAGGLSSSGAVSAPASTRQVWTYNQGEDRVNGQTYTCSMYFQYTGVNSGHNTLGFANSASGDAETSQGYGHRDDGLGVAFNGTDLLLVNTEGAGSMVSDTHTAAVSGNWYFVDLMMTFDGGNSFTLTSSMYNSHSDGTVGAQIGTISTTMNNNIMSGAGQYFATFGGNGANNTFSPMDNFETTAIPEPSTLILAGGAGLGLIAMRRRFKR